MRPILVVEDDKKISKVVKVYLEGEGYRVITADSGRGAIDAALKEIPSLVILDLMLPDISGEEVCQELKETGDFPIIMVTAKSSENERVAGFALGADDYVVKPFSPRELVARVKAVLKRTPKHELHSPEQMSFNKGMLTIDARSYEVKKKGLSLTLTPTEFKILSVLSHSPGRVFTRGELVESALGYQFEGYERSIDAHIKNIRQKIEDDPRSPLFIHTVYGVGYKFAGMRDDKKSLG
ncbi:MAG: two component transcriptional regulator, winged helix family [Nitrospirae bacterium]|nr:two component transcriptional regulator, winged helix family [Nitrospirota bacterium]